jgi:uncharacterized membrane protein
MIEIIPNWHPIFVHFTVALLTTAGVLTVFAVLLPATAELRRQLETVARWNLWIGFGFAIATVFAGWVAYSTVVHDDVSHLAMRGHRNMAMTTISIYLAVFFWSVTRHWQRQPANIAFAALLLVATGCLAVTGFRGGELVYRYGVGVMALPDRATRSPAVPAAPAAAAEPATHDHAAAGH